MVFLLPLLGCPGHLQTAHPRGTWTPPPEPQHEGQSHSHRRALMPASRGIAVRRSDTQSPTHSELHSTSPSQSQLFCPTCSGATITQLPGTKLRSPRTSTSTNPPLLSPLNPSPHHLSDSGLPDRCSDLRTNFLAPASPDVSELSDLTPFRAGLDNSPSRRPPADHLGAASALTLPCKSNFSYWGIHYSLLSHPGAPAI